MKCLCVSIYYGNSNRIEDIRCGIGNNLEPIDNKQKAKLMFYRDYYSCELCHVDALLFKQSILCKLLNPISS